MTEAELLSHGIDPKAPVGRFPRIVGQPLDARCGDERYLRSASGAVSVFYGWYGPGQQRVRRIMAERLAAALKEVFP